MYNVLDRGVNMKEYTKNQVHEVACAFNEHKIIRSEEHTSELQSR